MKPEWNKQVLPGWTNYLFYALLILCAVSTLNAEERHTWYAVRVASFPQDQYRQGVNLCERLIKKGCLAYYYLKHRPSDDKVWCEVQVGFY